MNGKPDIYDYAANEIFEEDSNPADAGEDVLKQEARLLAGRGNQ